MNTSRTAALAAALLASSAGTTIRLDAQQVGDPSIPAGALNAFPTIVQAGTHPVLTWGIDYPQTIRDIATISSSGTVTPTEDVDVEVRLVISTGEPLTVSNGVSGKGSTSAVTVTFSPDGNSITVTSSKDLSNVVLEFTDGTHYKFDGLSGKSATFSGIGSNAGKAIQTAWIKSGSYLSGDGPGYGYRFNSPAAGAGAGELDVQIRADGTSTWTCFFFDSQNLVNPTKVEYAQPVMALSPIDVRARLRNSSGTWLAYRSTGTASNNVVALAAGDSLPATIPAAKRASIINSMNPYITSAGVVAIGPKDVLILYELETTDANATAYDLQDVVVLMTLSNESKSAKVRNNNGHGNNIDGVDSSNPGDAPFAEYDSDPNLDDEGSGGGAYPALN